MKLLLVRHAESIGNASGDYSIADSDSLSPHGRKQAQVLSETLKEQSFDRIAISPLSRAQQTAVPYLIAANAQAEIWPELAEACWQEQREQAASAWRSRHASLIDEIKDYANFRSGCAIQPIKDETFSEGLKRVYAAVKLISECLENDCQSMMIISHGHFIRELMNNLLKTENLYPHQNIGMSQLIFCDDWSLQYPDFARSEGA